MKKSPKIRQPFAAHDKQHSNAGLGTARATERIAKQAQLTLAKTGWHLNASVCQGFAAPAKLFLDFAQALEKIKQP